MSAAQLFTGDCLLVMADLDNDSIDSIVTDPPYGLSFMGKGWDHAVPGVEFWTEMLRVAKPGAYLLAFGGSRTFHRMACAIEDAGWEIRDTIMWLYGSGFPKSHNGPWGGTALKPAHEPIIMARKPLIGTVAANVLAYGTGGLNIDGCRVGSDGSTTKRAQIEGTTDSRAAYGNGLNGGGPTPIDAGRWPANVIHDGSEEVLAGFPDSKAGVERKQRGTGGMWSGRSNAPCGPQYGDDGSAARFFYCAKASKRDRDEGLGDLPDVSMQVARDTVKHCRSCDSRITVRPGNVLTCPCGNPDPVLVAVDKSPRKNIHPTVKPTELMRYLVRLVTPRGGTCLDPFCGSGSTGKGCALEWINFIGIDLDAEYTAIAERRISHAQEATA